ncbi:FxsA family protein [Pseudomonas mangrovi]|uniref:Membrane protein FxsA n=1 Tax=Pseudomonas mangrovi TaxID=2161748 RepID=A0A2T5PES8_9PSED|nr:FxsA family protein [Pseudomonas mangrovi]PTU76221.1 membrane protein FxsA [Pseudomonas mangrovi]
MRLLLLLILLFPLIELGVLIKLGSAIGVLPVLFLVIGSALFGAFCLRVAGVATAWRARERLSRGELPEQEMLEGLLIAFGGGLLLFPGVISDVFGLLLLFPPTRRLLVGRLRRRIEAQAQRQRAFADELAARSGRSPGERGGERDANLIEGEYERHDR